MGWIAKFHMLLPIGKSSTHGPACVNISVAYPDPVWQIPDPGKYLGVCTAILKIISLLVHRPWVKSARNVMA